MPCHAGGEETRGFEDLEDLLLKKKSGPCVDPPPLLRACCVLARERTSFGLVY